MSNELPPATCKGHTGKPKLRFETAAAAREYRRTHKQIGDKTIYQCSYCGGWHLTTRLSRAVKRGFRDETGKRIFPSDTP